MELQHAKIRGVAHCVIPQEFTIKKPIIPLPPPLQQLLPVVVGQSPTVQLSGAPAVVQVLVPSNQVIPNQIPVLVPSNPQQIVTPAIVVPRVLDPILVPTHAPAEPKTISSYILDQSTTTSKPSTTTTVSPEPLIIVEETTDPEIPPEEISALESEPIFELSPVKEQEEDVLLDPNSSRMHYSAEPPTDDELLSNGILIGVSVPEVIMPQAVAESSLRKHQEEDPPEMLHDQEQPPLPTEEDLALEVMDA